MSDTRDLTIDERVERIERQLGRHTYQLQKLDRLVYKLFKHQKQRLLDQLSVTHQEAEDADQK